MVAWFRVLFCFSFCLVSPLACGCASHPKMQDGMSVQVERGWSLTPARFYQRAKQVDGRNARDTLASHEESAEATQRGRTLDVASKLVFFASSVCLFAGSRQQSAGDNGVPLFIAAGAGAVVGFSFAIASDGSFITASEQYNAAVAPNTALE